MQHEVLLTTMPPADRWRHTLPTAIKKITAIYESPTELSNLYHHGLRKKLNNFHDLVCDVMASDKNITVTRTPVALVLLNPAVITDYSMQNLTAHEKAAIHKLPSYNDVLLTSYTEVKQFWTDLPPADWPAHQPIFINYLITDSLKVKVGKLDHEQMKTYFAGTARHVTGINSAQQRGEIIMAMMKTHAGQQGKLCCAQVPPLSEHDILGQEEEHLELDLQVLQQFQPPIQTIPTPTFNQGSTTTHPSVQPQAELTQQAQTKMAQTVIQQIIEASTEKRRAAANHISKQPTYPAQLRLAAADPTGEWISTLLDMIPDISLGNLLNLQDLLSSESTPPSQKPTTTFITPTSKTQRNLMACTTLTVERPTDTPVQAINNALQAVYGSTEYEAIPPNAGETFLLNVTESLAKQLGTHLMVNGTPIYIRYNPITRTTSTAPPTQPLQIDNAMKPATTSMPGRALKCYGCGETHTWFRCPKWKDSCTICNRLGHIAEVCEQFKLDRREYIEKWGRPWEPRRQQPNVPPRTMPMPPATPATSTTPPPAKTDPPDPAMKPVTMQDLKEFKHWRPRHRSQEDSESDSTLSTSSHSPQTTKRHKKYKKHKKEKRQSTNPRPQEVVIRLEHPTGATQEQTRT